MSFFRKLRTVLDPEETSVPEQQAVTDYQEPIEEWASGVVLMSDGMIQTQFNSVDQAKLAIKQLRLRKRELNTQKRSVNAEMKELRLARREQVARQGSKLQGGGKFGRAIRAGQTAGRDADRRQHVSNLAPYEQVKSSIDAQITTLDRVITHIEQWVIENSG